MTKQVKSPVPTINEQMSVKKAMKVARQNTLKQLLGYQAKYVQFKVYQKSVVAFCRYAGYSYAARANDFTDAIIGLRERIRYDLYQKEKNIFNYPKTIYSFDRVNQLIKRT